MVMNIYVNFSGMCAEAFRYYEEHLGGTINSVTTFGELPDQSQLDPARKHLVAHARISVGGAVLMGADIPNAEPMRSAYLSLNPDSTEEAERIYAALSEGGTVFAPLRETSFAIRYAQLRDRFGINWMILHQRSMAPSE